MFTDLPFLAVAADLRHRELLAEAADFRLARSARDARRAARATRRETPRRPPEVRPPMAPAVAGNATTNSNDRGPTGSARSEVAGDCRYPVPR